jgi:hypothetical protein
LPAVTGTRTEPVSTVLAGVELASIGRSRATRPQQRRSFTQAAGRAEEIGMMRKGPTYVGGFLGSLVGSMVPSLWGAGQLSVTSLLFFVIGGILGVWFAYRLLV